MAKRIEIEIFPSAEAVDLLAIDTEQEGTALWMGRKVPAAAADRLNAYERILEAKIESALEGRFDVERITWSSAGIRTSGRGQEIAVQARDVDVDTQAIQAEIEEIAQAACIEAIEAEPCDCGRASPVSCDSLVAPSEAVTVEWMPIHLRSSHEAAGNRGSYPHNGAERLTLAPACAEALLEHDGDWSERISA